MRDTSLQIRINRPIAEVFAFPLNPANTPLYWDAVVKEETSGPFTMEILEKVKRVIEQS